MEIKNIVVTGGAGFIGSHLCEILIKQGHHVICIDNLQGGLESNINHLFAHPHFEFLHLDITQPIVLEEIAELKRFSIQGKGIQEIYHLACPTSPREFLHVRKETLWANSVGILNILEMAKRYSAKLVFTSSSVVYGAREHHEEAVAEDNVGVVDFLSMRACYDEGKRFAESCVSTYGQLYRMDAKIARVFRTYGPRMPINQGHMIPDFILAALDHKPLVIHGQGSFTTSLLYIDDCVDALLKLMDSPMGLGPVNIGGEQEHRIEDVAKMALTLTQSSCEIQFHEPILFTSPLPLPNINKAKRELNWFPLVSLEQGLRSSIQYTLAEKGILHG